MKNKNLFILITLILFNACKRADNSLETKLLTNSHFWKIKKNGSQSQIVGWEQYQNDTIEIKVPLGWKIKKSKDSWIMFPYNKLNQKLYFAINKYNVAEVKLNAESYVREGFMQISDKIDKFNYVLKKLNFANGTECYLLTIFTREENHNYITYSLIYQPENIIYDFAFKTLDDQKDNEVNYRTFLLIVQSFEANNDKIIDSSQFIVNDEKELKFEDLK